MKRPIAGFSIVAGLLVLSGASLVFVPETGAQSSARNRNPVQLLLATPTVDDRVAYTGVLQTEIRSPRLQYEMDLTVVNVPPDVSERVVLEVRLDGEAVSEEDEDVEIVERRISHDNSGRLAPPAPGGPLGGSGTRSFSDPVLFELGRFRITDPQGFLESYDVRSLGTSRFFDRSVVTLAIEPKLGDLPHYELALDRRTALVVRSVVTFPKRPNLRFSHRFLSLEIQDEGEPIETIPLVDAGAPQFDLTPREAAELVPGFSMPRELPRGFRVTNLSPRKSGGSVTAIRIDISNGLESYFVLVRPAALLASDPVDAMLRRHADEAGIPREERPEYFERMRPRVERVIESILAEREGGTSRSNVAWRQRSFGITRYTIFGDHIDLALVGRVSERDFLRTADSVLGR